MAYTPMPGTVAARIIAWLEAQGRTTEWKSVQIAVALDLDQRGITAHLERALAGGLVFRRQIGRSGANAPFWYSLTNHSPLEAGQ